MAERDVFDVDEHFVFALLSRDALTVTQRLPPRCIRAHGRRIRR